MLDDNVKAEIRLKAENEFKAKFEQKIKLGNELQKEYNIKALERFAERQQHLALNLSADENVSLTPEFAAKIADIRARIEANQVSKDQIAQMRTQIKATAEEFRGERDSLVANIREESIQHRTEMIERIIAYAQEKNVSTTELTDAHAQLLTLLDSYESGSLNASEFAKQADVLHKSTVALLNSAALVDIHNEIKVETKDERIELREENKATMEAWREERKQIAEDLREGNKLRLEMRKDLKDGLSEMRAEVRSLNGSRMEIRERIKDGVVETRIRERMADSVDSDDELEVEDESEEEIEVEDENEVEDESDDENEVEDAN